MNRISLNKKGLAVTVILLFLGMSVVPLTGTVVEKKSTILTSFYDGDTLYVGGDGSGNYSKIQDAIDDASNGDTVFVYDNPSPYYESIVVDNSINLIGQDKNTTVIDGDRCGNVISISADGTTVSGFSIRKGGNKSFNSGIVIYSNNNRVFDNLLYNNGYYAIYLCSSSNNYIYKNLITNNSLEAIYLSESNYNVILNNTITNNDGGITLGILCSDNHIINNTISFVNSNGINLWGESSYNMISGNSINNVAWSGIVIYWGENNTILDNDIYENHGDGIALCTPNYNIISNCNIYSNNHSGIYISCSSNNTVFNCNIYSNNNYGISLIYSANNNILYHNSLINNNPNAYDECVNTWDNGYPSGGNYWDDYTGVDGDGDGVGDIPYNIPGGNNQDRYPLMESYGMTELTISMGSGLFKFSGTIKNIGNKTAFNVQWKITFDGGIILFGRESSGYLPGPLLAGEEMSVSSGIVFGLGRIVITVSVWADNAPLVSKSIHGFLFLIFIKINPGD